MANAHRRFLDADDLQQVLRRAGLTSPITEHTLLEGGTFNSVYRLRFADRPGLILKVSPEPDGAVMTYENGIVATEAEFYRQAASAGVPVPEVIAVLDLEPEAGGGQVLLMTELPGSPWSVSPVPEASRGLLRAELGRLMAQLHTVTGPSFGYPSASTGPLTEDWSTAFTAMVEAVLGDAERYRAELPVEPQRIRKALVACEPDLAAVLVPVLVHFDLWDGNVLLDRAGPVRISGLIDGERAMWADPVMDFVSAALFAEIRDDEDFVRGYEHAGAKVPLDPSARRRLLLYRIYLGLIMVVEPYPREDGQGDDRLNGIVGQGLVADLAEVEQLSN